MKDALVLAPERAAGISTKYRYLPNIGTQVPKYRACTTRYAKLGRRRNPPLAPLLATSLRLWLVPSVLSGMKLQAFLMT